MVDGIIMVYVDDVLMAGGKFFQKDAAERLSTQLKRGTVAKNVSQWNGVKINWKAKDVKLVVDMEAYLDKLKLVERKRGRPPGGNLAEAEISEYRSVHGVLAWLSTNVRPQQAAACSDLAIGMSTDGTVKDARSLNKDVNKVQKAGKAGTICPRKQSFEDEGELGVIGFTVARFMTRRRPGSQRAVTAGIMDVLHERRTLLEP